MDTVKVILPNNTISFAVVTARRRRVALITAVEDLVPHEVAAKLKMLACGEGDHE